MQFIDIMRKCVGQTVVINNGQERVLAQVDEDFLILQGGNPQMRLTEFVPLAHVQKIIRADYATGDTSVSLDFLVSGGDQVRGAADQMI